jgi:hypothetical protein
MACVLSSTWTLGCRDKQGGIQKVYIGSWNSGLTYTSGTGSITAFSGVTSSFYTFEQELDTASFVQKSVPNTENGTNYYEQTVSITLQGLDAATSDRIRILDQGKWRIIVLDQNGKYWLAGKQNGVRTYESTPGVGKVGGDLNGAVITFIGREPAPAFECTAGSVTILIV